MKKLENGYFIVIEGCDGSGKTTLAKNLVNKLNSEGIDAIYVREPGGIPEAEQVRNIVLNNTLDSRQYTLLFMTSASLNIQRIIKPALAKKKVVICDRFIRSTWIYQKFCNFDPYADNYDDDEDAIDLWDTFHTLAEYACFGLTPDVEFILDTSAEVAWDRINNRNKSSDVFEMLGFNHHKEICDNYIECDDDELYGTYSDMIDVEHVNTDYMNPDGVLKTVYDKLMFYLNMHEGNVSKDEIEEFYNKKYGYTEEE